MSTPKNWILRNWKWLVPSIGLFLFLFLSLPKTFTEGATHIAIGYTDTELCESAIQMAKKNERVKEMLGDLQPMRTMTILEGYVKYSKELDSVFMALTIQGTKGKGKIDIKAFKNKDQWVYESLAVRLKEPKFRKETIPILATSH